jgi:hypothetical protein
MNKNKGATEAAPNDYPMKYDSTRYASSAKISVVKAQAIGRNMESNIILEPQTLDLKVLIEHDAVYQTYVARCLETGAVATGETPDDASEQIKHTLELDVQLAEEQGGLEALFYTRAEPAVWDRWYQAKAISEPEIVTLNIMHPQIARRGVNSVTISTAIRKTA